MTEEQHASSATTSESRPQMVRGELRKVPGGFGIDDEDDLSPKKDQFDDSILAFANVNAQAYAQNSRIPSLDPATLPSLPPPTDSSLVFVHSENGQNSDGHLDSLDENAMQRHLNDVEDSFLPAPSPIGIGGEKGTDDTYLFDEAQPPPRGGQNTVNEPSAIDKNTVTSSKEDAYQSWPPTPPGAYRTPAPTEEDFLHGTDNTNEVGNTTASLETMSSPTAAAAARTISRAASMTTVGGYVTANDASNPNSQEHTDEEDEEEDVQATPKSRRHGSYTDSDSHSTLRHHLSNHSLAADAGNTPGIALLNRNTSGTRPKFLRSRHASQRSSISSFVTNPDSHEGGSDITLGADYALQSGGAAPGGGGFSRNSSYALSRSISLGSMASGIEDLHDVSPKVDGTLATLTEEEQNRERKAIEDLSPPETPRATNRKLTAPTDTVIARHVQNVQVPESLAKEYRNKSASRSPEKRSGFATGSILGRSGKNLTLKEQSSTIERLSKENFDLKLKVMFLSDRLDKLSEEGVKEMISENVEMKTGLAVMQRDNKALKRRVKELEKQLKDDEDRPGTAKSGTSTGDPSPRWFDQEGAQEREEELLYLRERVEEYVTEIEKLRNEGLQRENEKRNLAEVVRSMGDRQSSTIGAREEMDVWKDLLEQETARREQGDEDIKKLREEIFRLKSETSASSGAHGLTHTTNIYNITKKRALSPSRPRSGLSDRTEDRQGTVSATSTLVEDLRRESEQLKHENAELRREVGAQTSMLTSRNREKERLYQEIEELKLGQRRGGGSIAGESILERSASRAHERSLSRNSAGTRQTSMTDSEREDFENKHAELRDGINSLKIHNQDLQRELESCMEDFEIAVEQKKQAETLAAELQDALETANADLLTMQTDRDEALQGQEEAEIMFDSLRKEAQEELDGFAAEAEEASSEIERLHHELADSTENFNALQNEMRDMSEGIVRLEDDHENNMRRIQDLEKDLEEANRELEQMEKNLVEANEKINRLGVQQESSQSEIAFLREEQDGDKIKIGDLEAALRNTEQSLQEERECTKELEQRLANERHQREVVASKEKQEVQQFVNDLNREASTAKDEARRLRKSLTSREIEAAEWKQRLMELEGNLREALGDLNGTRSSLLTVSHSGSTHLGRSLMYIQSISKLQRELENTIRDLDNAKSSLAEKERLIKQRDVLLETHGLESRKLADILDKERQAHRNTKHQFETFQKSQQHTERTLSQQESRVLELETTRQQDRRKLATLENAFKDQLNERNNLLLALWNHLSSLCGTDWANNNRLINGRALPTLETVSTMFPSFSKNLLAAVKTIETLVGDFQSRIRSVERDLWKEYQTLESTLELRTKTLDRLETMTRSAIPGARGDSKREMEKLKELNRNLKIEIGTLRAANEVRTGAYRSDPSPSPSVPTGPRSRVVDKAITSTLTRHHSASTFDSSERATSSRGRSRGGEVAPSLGDEEYKPDLLWQVRLRELEYKLKAEREARTLDRNSAIQRLEEKSRENAELAAEVARNRARAEVEKETSK
jgi:predicted  nucleic acid-binding Zn-ribbon protein